MDTALDKHGIYIEVYIIIPSKAAKYIRGR